MTLKISDIYNIGEEFETVYMFDENVKGMGDITAKVTEVQIADNLDLLGESPYIANEWKQEVDENGLLK